jgi:hypothetical protein
VLTKKLIGAVALAVGITIFFALAKLTLPLKTIVGLSLAIFAGCLLSYLWQPRKLTFGRLILWALVTTGVTAAILVISRLWVMR